jgi:hypothetical protein
LKVNVSARNIAWYRDPAAILMVRRRSHEVQADQAALRDRQEEFERQAIARPSTSWAEAAARARYLIQLFASTPEGRDPRRQELILQVLENLTRLSS